jgi:hypothetical protein
LVCQKQPKAVQPAQPTSQSCQKTNFKKTYGSSTAIYVPWKKRIEDINLNSDFCIFFIGF